MIITLPGAKPSEIEDLIVKPAERVINQIPGVDHVFSTAMDSAAVISVQYKVNENKEASLVKLYDRFRSARSEFPKEASDARIISADADDVPILAVTLTGGGYDDYALRRIAERFVEGLTSLKDVSTSYVYDGRTREFEVTMDPKKLASFGIPAEAVRLALKTTNIAAPLGSEAAADTGRTLRYDGFVTSAADLKRLVIASPGGAASAAAGCGRRHRRTVIRTHRTQPLGPGAGVETREVRLGRSPFCHLCGGEEKGHKRCRRDRSDARTHPPDAGAVPPERRSPHHHA